MSEADWIITMFLGLLWLFVLALAWAIDRLERRTGIKP